MSKIVATLFALVLCAMLRKATSVNIYDIQKYDVGCYNELGRMLQLYGFIGFQMLVQPACRNGGLYAQAQCRRQNKHSRVRCYCAYVDTGAEITEISLENGLTYSAMLDNCPKRTEKPSDSCSTPPINSPCRVETEKFKYNPKTQTCVSVSYGCYGHATEEDCMNTCAPKVYDECSFPMDMGYPCSQPAGTRYRYHPGSEQCEPFPYRGCGGNSNSYKHEWQCQKSCAAQEEVTFQVEVEFTKLYNVTAYSWVLNKYSLADDQVNDVTVAEFKDIKEDSISTDLISDSSEDSVDSRQYTLGGSDGFGGSPPSSKPNRDGMTRREVCHQAPYTGLCRAYMPRWFYNRTASICEQFIFGGCLPKANNFETLSECNHFCKPRNQPSPEQISGAPRPGAGNNPNGEDPYLEDGAEVVYRISPILQPPPPPSPSAEVGPRSFLLSEGNSGEGPSGNGANQNT
uniref:Papilin n=1 Tax=Phallusia mammillata TaxID=59560 RepID=A0A6F9DNU0_9ASCI|nr:papilin [Phallusia mammillata]